MSRGAFEPSELWSRRCFDPQLNFLGRVEALAFRHGRVRAVGIEVGEEESPRLVFVRLEGAHIDNGDLVLEASAAIALGRVRLLH